MNVSLRLDRLKRFEGKKRIDAQVTTFANFLLCSVVPHEHEPEFPTLSSCEAEYYAVVNDASRALVLQTATEEFGIVIGAVGGSTTFAGAKNSADILTKYIGVRDYEDQLMRVCVQVVAREMRVQKRERRVAVFRCLQW